MPRRTFVDYLKELREDRKLNLRQVEELTGISNPYLSQIEQGKRGIPTIKILRKLADAYRVPLREFFNVISEEAESGSVRSKVPPPIAQAFIEKYERAPDEIKRAAMAVLDSPTTAERRSSRFQPPPKLRNVRSS
jgi:transcriptional regulator with XRE-family HTH domain